MSNEELKAGTIVKYWPGIRAEFIQPRGLAEVISDGLVKFGGTDCYRVRMESGGTDYIAATHVEAEVSK